MKKKYIDFDPSKGYPASKKLNYECGICGDVLPSIPIHSLPCSCRNIVIDIDAGRISVKENSQIKIFEMV